MKEPQLTDVGHSPSALLHLLEPRSVAVVGASAAPGSVGALTVTELLAGGYPGDVFPVNPKHRQLHGLSCYASLADLPSSVDVAVIAVSNARLEDQLELAARCGIRAAVIYASGFEEPAEGRPSLTARLASIARDHGMAVCGGNGMGLVNTAQRLRLCGYLLPRELGPGPVSIVSHSGSTFSALLHNNRRLRFGLAVSPGQELTATSADYLGYSARLEGTRVVGLMLEQIREPAAFAAAVESAHARGVAVVVLKVGAAPQTKALISAHSGALAGDDGAYEAFFDDVGVHRVRTLDEMADTLELFAAGRRAASGGLSVVSDSGGERALITDLAGDVPLTRLGPETTSRLVSILDPGLPPVNPLDAFGTGADSQAIFARSLQALHDDEGTGALVFAVDLTGLSCDGYADIALSAASCTTKPFAVLTNVPAGMNREAAERIRSGGIPLLEGTATGLAAIGHLFDERDFAGRPELRPPPSRQAERRTRWIERLADGGVLGEVESLALVADWGIEVSSSEVVHTEADALAAAARLGWPVALKTAAPAIAHKSDAGGVVLGIEDAGGLSEAYRALAARLGPDVTVQAMAPAGVELALGIVDDDSFGPLVVVAAGGTLVEVIADRRVAMAPLDLPRAARLLDGLKIRRLLDGHRGAPPADLDAVLDAVVSVSALARDLAGHLQALDINPLVCTPGGCVAVDALVEPKGRP